MDPGREAPADDCGEIVRTSIVIAATTVMTAAPSGPWSVGGRPSQLERPASIAELWTDPGAIERRDAYNGSGGAEGAPRTEEAFEVTSLDVTGYSRGYTVTDAQGRVWSVKLGAEAQPEFIASRVLWLIGYRQPTVYFVPAWRRNGDDRPQPPARFRLQSDHVSIGAWSWTDNPFAGTRQLNGLVAVNLLLNNWDFKTSNNRLYSVWSSNGPERWFVVQDLGASLGGTAWPIGTRNDIERFEAQRYVAASDGELRFDYRGRHRDVFERVTAEDVVWACRLLDRISEQQWIDLFKAAAYPEAIAARYRAHLEAKIAEGLALSGESGVQP
jgi:hypothetical protein